MSKPYHIKSERKEFNPVLDKLFKNAGIGTENKQTQNWEEIDGIFQTVAVGIVSIAAEVNDAIKAINLLGIHSNAELAISVRGLTRDLETYSKDLAAIKARHVGMTGKVKDGDELALCLSVFEDYAALNDRFRANIFQVMVTVTEHLAEAVANRNKEIEAQQLQDPNIVTDVVVKETKND